MALLHFPVLNSSVDAECENLTFKVSCVVKVLLRTLKKKILQDVERRYIFKS